MHPRVSLRVVGMSCNGCVAAVRDALVSVPDASAVSVDLSTCLAQVCYPHADPSPLLHAVENVAKKQATLLHITPTPVAHVPRAVVLQVHGMTCINCVHRVTAALQALPTACNVHVDLASGLATLQYAGEDAQLVVAVAEGASKEAVVVPAVGATTVRVVTLRVQGMTCQKCVAKVQSALEAVPFTSKVAVDLPSGLATLTFDGDVHTLVEAVRVGAGKKAVLAEGKGSDALQSPVLDRVDLCSPTEDVRAFPGLPESRAVEGVREKVGDDVGDDMGDNVGEEMGVAAATTTKMTPTTMTTTQLRVGGMTCSSCVGVVEKLLSEMQGVRTARVNLLAGRATVVHDGEVVVAQALASAMMSAGYKSLVLESCEEWAGGKKAKAAGGPAKFRIEFPTDVQAQNALRILRFLSGVEAVDVMGSTASVMLAGGFAKSVVLRVLELDGGCGKMMVKRSLAAERAAEARGDHLGATDVIDEETEMWRRRFQLAVTFVLPIMFLGFLQHRTNFPSMLTVQWMHFALATPVQFICGWGFYRASYFALRKGRATMDLLVAMSTSIAYFSSVVVVVFGLGRDGGGSLGHSAMFNVSAMIITMVLVGKWLEATAKRRAAAGVAALSALTPEDAVLYDEREGVSCHTEVAVTTLDVGDIVKLIPGDRVPTDGEVITGNSAVDESMLTGESNAVPKAPGDFVYGGTVNGRGSLLVRTTAVGTDAVLSQIVKLVNDAQTTRAPIEAFADRVSAVFVPAVVSFSAIVFVAWYCAARYRLIPHKWWEDEGELFFALLFALETMVIACPCALGLATPTAVMVASEVGTKLGVLFRGGGAALEAANNVKTVVFDKTGTLTMGKPAVTAVLIGGKYTEDVEQASVILSDLILLVETESHHPLASAISRYLRDRCGSEGEAGKKAYKISEIEELPGRGMKATINNGEFSVRIGSRAWAFGNDGFLERKLLSDSEISQMERMELEDGLTVVVAIVNDFMVVVYGLEDTVRAEAEAVISYLHHNLGVDCRIVTGDSEETGRAVARSVGIAPGHLQARALPWTKVDYVKALPAGSACFVGDGINDAPALAAAALGVAIGAGAPVAAENAAVVLVRSDLRGVAHTLALARATFRRVQINFIWAIGYNVLGMPLAAGVLYPFFGIRVPPLVASGAMALSSTCVIVSSLALRFFKEPELGHTGLRRGNIELRPARKRSAEFEIGDVSSPGSSEDGMYSLGGVSRAPLLGEQAA